MKVKVQPIVESESHQAPVIEEVGCLERGDLTPEALGLTLTEAKDLLANVQATMVAHQVTEYVEQQRPCLHCGKVRPQKDQREIVFHFLFGELKLSSPRLYTCSCQVQSKRSESPLAELLPERTAPELLYLQTKWASLMSYGLTVDLLGEVLPIHISQATVFRNVQQVAERLESELGDEQYTFIEGCPRDWENLPPPDGPLTVGIDGGYVHAREGQDRKAGQFEVIVGKSITAEGEKKCFGFVNGGDTVRDLQLYLSPQAEYLLDWFHVTMRLTVMN